MTSSDFPNYDRNHNTEKDQNFDAELRTANQAVYSDKDHPSRVILPRTD